MSSLDLTLKEKTIDLYDTEKLECNQSKTFQKSNQCITFPAFQVETFSFFLFTFLKFLMPPGQLASSLYGSFGKTRSILRQPCL